MAYKIATNSTEGLVGFREFIQGQCTPISGKSYKFLVATFTFTAAYDTSQSILVTHKSDAEIEY